jgi:hypothetical protein
MNKRYEGLMRKFGVVAVGRGKKMTGGKTTDENAFVCSVKKKLPRKYLKSDQLIPSEYQGTSTDVIETGEISIPRPRPSLRTSDSIEDPTNRFRPAPGGVSVGHFAITAGTLGCWVKDRNDRWVILSNNHVLANSNDANLGDDILQPGPHDGGGSSDVIATLQNFAIINFGSGDLPSDCNIAKKWVKFSNWLSKITGSKTRIPPPTRKFSTENLIDAAIATPIREEDVKAEILEIGKISNKISPAYLGMEVQKFGRTTGYNTGEVLQVDVAANVGYGNGKVAVFTDQILMGPMSAGGDSGSLIVDMHGNPTGLLFAGSDEVTIANRIENVASMLEIHFA